MSGGLAPLWGVLERLLSALGMPCRPFKSTDAAMEELVGKLGYSKFLEMSTKQLMKQWATLHPDPKAAKKEEKKKGGGG